MSFILSGIVLYILTGIYQLLLKNGSKFYSSIILNAAALILTVRGISGILINGGEESFCFNIGKLFSDIVFKLDPLSAFFILLITGASFLSLLYGKKYLEPYKKNIGSHLLIYNLFTASMILVTLCQNALFFLILWEIMSITSFLLILYEGENEEVKKSAIQYLVMMHIGIIFLTLGFLLLYIKTGSFLFCNYKGHITDIIFVLMFIGFGIKAGFAPLHTWLPKAHPMAPTHISAVMSGVMIKTGIYGILRFLTLDTNLSMFIGYFILIVGILSAFFGILYAICQRDFKKMLAYSSVENMGIVAIAIGIGVLGLIYDNDKMASLGFLGCFLHLLNHTIFKSALFFCAGSIYKQSGTKDIEKLGGLIKKMPHTAYCFLIASLAICALPPFNGFISEFIIYLGFLNSFSVNNYFLIPVMIISMAVLAFVGAMALVAFTNAFGIIFLSERRSDIEVKNDVSNFMKIPVYLNIILIIIIGLFPQNIVNILCMPTEMYSGFLPVYDILSGISVINIAMLFMFICFFGLRWYLVKGKTYEEQTWCCGYKNITRKMQYTSTSFTRPFLGFLTPFYKRILEFKPIKELFPKKTAFKSKIYDIFDNYLIRPLVKTDEFIIKKFYWIQSGNTQRYMWYGVVALIISIILVLGDKI